MKSVFGGGGAVGWARFLGGAAVWGKRTYFLFDRKKTAAPRVCPALENRRLTATQAVGKNFCRPNAF